MHRLIVRRVQYPVGQGGFHVADLLARGKPFRYIYDCGSRNSGAVDAVLAGLSSGTREESYDWLVISSFDMDHFSGIEQLLARKHTFKRVFLPHGLDKAFLEWLLICYVLEGREHAEILVALNALTAIVAGKFGTIAPAKPNDPPKPSDNEEGSDDVVQLVEEHYDEKSGIVGRLYRVKGNDWIFRFYSQEHDFTVLVSAILDRPELRELAALIRSAGATVRGQAGDTAAILTELAIVLKKTSTQSGGDASAATAPAQAPGKPAKKNKSVGTPAVAEEKLRVKDLLANAYAEARDNGKRVFADYNALSLCLYAGPRAALHPTRSDFLVTRQVGDSLLEDSAPNARRQVGWLGTGDIGFADQAAFDRFAQYFASDLPLAHTKMVPHHGSQKSYGKKIELIGSFLRLGVATPLWIAAAHPLGGYRHPDGVVVIECQKHGTFRMVSEDSASRIEEFVYTMPRPIVRMILGDDYD